MSRLYLIDSMSLVFRAYYAMARSSRPLTAPNGEPTGAVFGFASILTSLLEKENVDYIACVFDTKEPTFRHKMYNQYKANRAAFPEELIPQLGRIKELIDYMGIQRIEVPGFEADDIIGTLALEGERKDVDVYCLTSDKDYYQLVDSKVRLLKPGANATEYEVHGEEQCAAKFGVKPHQVIDVLALIGDTSDNVPGVKGVGEKTAIPLVQQYGTLENIYEHIEEITKESLKKKLIEHREMAFLSKTLVTIERNVPTDIDFHTCKMQTPDYAKLDSLFEMLNFKTMRLKWQQKSGAAPETQPLQPALATQTVAQPQTASTPETEAPQLQTLQDIPHEYILVRDEQGLQAMMNDLRSAKQLAVDLETTSLDAMQCEIVGISVCAEQGKAYYISVDGALPPALQHNTLAGENLTATNNVSPDATINMFAEPTPEYTTQEQTPQGLYTPHVLDTMRPLLEGSEYEKWGQNIKFDSLILKRYGIDVTPIAFDSMLASYVLNPDQSHGMDALAQQWMGYSPISITTLIGAKKSTQISMRDVDVERVAEYAAEDADVTYKLCALLTEQLAADDKLNNLARTIEIPLVPVLRDMEFNGIAIDTGRLSGISEHIRRETAIVREKIISETGGIEFNIDSTKQLGEVLFDRMKLPVIKKNKTGYSTDVQVLTELSESFPIANMILEYRQMQKLQSTYVEALPRMVNPNTKRVHTTYNQTVASTGRLASTDPNLQNIPIRSELGRSIRTAFVAQAPNAVILSADYSQIELRIMAHVCGDETLINAFKNGHDIHKATAANLFGVPLDEVTSDMRRIAKTVNFGIMYGQGAFGLARQLGIDNNQAKEIITNYFARYSRIKQYIEQTIHQAEIHGYVETICGRRRYFPDITSKNRNIKSAAERTAVNTPIQGSAADMIKLAMINIHASMKRLGMKSLMMLQVHDELVFEAMPGEINELTALVKETMEAALPLGSVPVLVETGTGNNWDEAH